MSFFKSIFSSDKNNEAPTRILDDARKLRCGDLVVLDDGFGMPKLLRGETFEIRQVNTYQFARDHYPEFVLKGKHNRSLFLTIEDEDQEEYAAFSIRIERSDVEQLFDLDQFAVIFDVDELAELTTQESDIDFVDGFTAKRYLQKGGSERGYFYDNKDYRPLKPPSHEGVGEPFDYFSLFSDDEGFAIDIEVWEDGETDVTLTIYRPLTDIKELWPGSGSVKK